MSELSRRGFIKSALALSLGMVAAQKTDAATLIMNIPIGPATTSSSSNGPGFVLPVNMPYAGVPYRPFVGTYGSAESVFVNVGQQAFIGDPGGFKAWDSAFSGNWSGFTSGVDNLLLPSSTGSGYSVFQTTGKWYWEMTFNSSLDPYHLQVGITSNNGTKLNYYATGSGVRTRTAMYGKRYNNSIDEGYLNVDGASLSYGWNIGDGKGSTGIHSGDVVGIWVDLDKPAMLVAKIGTTQSMFPSAVAYP